MNRWINRCQGILFPVMIFGFVFLMVQIVVPYTSWRWDVDFLLTKQAIIHLDHYRLAFYIHIFSSVLVLASGALLFSSWLLKYSPVVHRFFGRIYVLLVLLLSAPSGLVMAFYANGGPGVILSFVLLTPLWWYFTLQGLISALQKDFYNHRFWMWRSYALTCSAITLRTYQYLLGYFPLWDPIDQYLYISWMSWLGNWLVVEGIILYEKRRRRSPKPSLEHSGSNPSPLSI